MSSSTPIHREIPLQDLWNKIYTVAPLILVGTREEDSYDLAPKHMATPLGPGPYFGFVCTPHHSTFRNVMKYKEFAVSFPKPSQIVISSLTSNPRPDENSHKPVIGRMETRNAEKVDAPILEDAYLFLECELKKIVEGFDGYSLICGRIIHAGADPEYIKQSEFDEADQIHANPYLAYLAHGRWASITNTYSFPFPKGFKR